MEKNDPNLEQFERVLKGLRFGDAGLALESAENAEVLNALAHVEEIWPLFSAALQNGMASETPSPCEMQPGSSGTWATNHPASSGSRVTISPVPL